jgi:4-amino-4-deoxy-L-arabinose transferase-like glycosyltransferase
LYYYLAAVFYFLTRLDPVASPLLAGATSIFSFFVIYYVSKKLFSKNIALLSCGIYTFSSFIIHWERTQGPINFISPLSLLIFYFLYRVITGEAKYLPHLAFVTGLSLHAHFTSLFYPIIILFSLPLFPWSKKIWKYILLSTGIFLTLCLGQIAYYSQQQNSGSINNYSNYLQTYYHGFHLRRFFQLSYDAFIKFQQILEIPYTFIRNTVFFYIPIFAFAYLRDKKIKNGYKLIYILILWIFVPWILFSVYSGEISDYYFSLQLYLAVIIFAYLTVWVWQTKYIAIRIALIAFWLIFAVSNVNTFLHTGEGNFVRDRASVEELISAGRPIQFVEGDPKPFWWVYLSIKHKLPPPYGN